MKGSIGWHGDSLGFNWIWLQKIFDVMCNSLNQSQMCKTQWSCLIFTGHLKFVLLSLDSMTRYTEGFSFGTASSAASSEYLYLHLKLYLFSELHKFFF
jgi:hypothetical protein